jgi:sigma54-dependent transcription regulator
MSVADLAKPIACKLDEFQTLRELLPNLTRIATFASKATLGAADEEIHRLAGERATGREQNLASLFLVGCCFFGF